MVTEISDMLIHMTKMTDSVTAMTSDGRTVDLTPWNTTHEESSAYHRPLPEHCSFSSENRCSLSHRVCVNDAENVHKNETFLLDSSSSRATTSSEADVNIVHSNTEDTLFDESEVAENVIETSVSTTCASKSKSDDVARERVLWSDQKYRADERKGGTSDSKPYVKVRNGCENINRPALRTPLEIKSLSAPPISCDFTDRKNVQTLVKLSEDMRFFKLFYVLHSKCSSLGSKSFGPWCYRTSSKRTKLSSGVSGSSNKSFKESLQSSTKEKNHSDRFWQTSPNKNGGGRDKPVTNAAGVREKNAKTNDVFDRLSGQGPPYVFRHLSDIGSYMSEYREQYTVGLVCRKLKRAPVLGMDVPDPYFCKKKKSCSCLTCAPPNQTKMAAGSRDGVGVHSESSGSGPSGSGKDNCVSADKQLGRSVPNLAPVREKKTASRNSQSVNSPSSKRPAVPDESSRPASDPASLPLLVLPSIQVQQESKRLALVGHSAVNGAMGNQAAMLTAYSSSTMDDVKDSTKTSEDEANSIKGKEKRKKGPFKLKYTNRPAVAEAAEVTRESNVTTSKGSTSSSTSVQSFSKNTAASQPTSVSVTETKIKTRKAEEPSCKKESKLPGLVRKGLEDEQGQRELVFHKGRYAMFTLAQKIHDHRQPIAGDEEREGRGPRVLNENDFLGRAERSRSVEILPGSRNRKKKDRKTSLSSTTGKDGFLRVKVMSVDDIPTRLSLEKGTDLNASAWKHSRPMRLPKVPSLHLNSEQTHLSKTEEVQGNDKQVVLILPDKQYPDLSRSQGIGDCSRRKDDKDRRSVDRNSESGVTVKVSDSGCDGVKLQKDFTPRTQRDKTTSLKILQKNTTSSSDSVKPLETIGIRGKTITDFPNSDFPESANGETPETKKEASPSNSQPKTSPSRPPKTNYAHKGSHWFPGKPSKRDPAGLYGSLNSSGKDTTNTYTTDNHSDKHQKATMKFSSDNGASLSSIYPGSLVIKGGPMAADGTTRMGGNIAKRDNSENIQSVDDVHPVRMESRRLEEGVSSLDKNEHVTVVS